MHGFIAAVVVAQFLVASVQNIPQDPTPKQQEKNIQAPRRVNALSLGIKTSAESVLVVDDASGAVLYAKQGTTVQSIASITKLMTALVFLEHNPGWEVPVTIQSGDIREGGIPYFAIGDVVQVRDLWHAMVIGSSNEAAIALARATGIENFAEAMNTKAIALGMSSAHFVDPSGYESDNSASAHDVYLLATAAFAMPDIAEATQLKSYTFELVNKKRSVTIRSTNQLLNSFVNANPYRIVAGKTGYLDEAGYCMTVRVQHQDGRMVTVVLLGADQQVDRWQEIKGLVDWVMRSYEWPA